MSSGSIMNSKNSNGIFNYLQGHILIASIVLAAKFWPEQMYRIVYFKKCERIYKLHESEMYFFIWGHKKQHHVRRRA